ncbi:MAG: hypothetical protein KatS3mg114_0381 [Planctomycetaceae bacterium]|nr:MAG: hypothetical protein KatS3mg114_0381 [Planctomycetaceae bacterium]
MQPISHVNALVSGIPLSLPRDILQGARGDTSAPVVSFENLLWAGIQSVEQQQTRAQEAVLHSLVADDPGWVETLAAVREADLALRLMVQVRNKLVEAYQELQQLRF